MMKEQFGPPAAIPPLSDDQASVLHALMFMTSGLSQQQKRTVLIMALAAEVVVASHEPDFAANLEITTATVTLTAMGLAVAHYGRTANREEPRQQSRRVMH